MQQQMDFNLYIRTGRMIPVVESVELKFNPYHDPRDGRFTFAPGRGTLPSRGPGKSSSSHAQRPPGRQSRASEGQNASGRGKPVVEPLPYLSTVHNDLRQSGSAYPPEKETREWSPRDLALSQLGVEREDRFKAQWVRGYRKAIRAAAAKFGLPAELVAGVAFKEVAGDPLEIDSVAYALRGREARDFTSFGNVSMQVRRAATTLGYGSSQQMTQSQRCAVIASLKDPGTNIFIAAKHLADLRRLSFPGSQHRELTLEQAEIVATRYNRGPEASRDSIKGNAHYGRVVTRNWKLWSALLRD